MPRRIRAFVARSYNRFARTVFRPAPPVFEKGLDRTGSAVHEFGERYQILEFADCTLWPHFSIAAGRSIFSETALCPAKMDWLQPRLRRFPVLRIRGDVTCIGDIWHNYYHRYVDLLPKVHALHAASLQDRKIALILTAHFRRDDVRILEALLPPNVTIQSLPRYVRIVVDRYVHLPRLSTNPDKPCRNDSSIGFLPDSYLQWYRQRVFDVLNVHTPAADRRRHLYISRSKARKRRIHNERELTAILSDYDFEVIHLEDLTLRDQVALFSEAAVVVAQHGAALTNILYASPGSALIELVSSTTGQEIHYSLGAVKLGMIYYRIPLETVDGRKDTDGMVDVEGMRATLDEAMRRKEPGRGLPIGVDQASA